MAPVRKLVYWISKSESRFVANVVTLLAPATFVRMFYENNKGKSWNGKKSCFTLSFDVDMTKDVKALPSLLDLLSPYSFRTCFACVGAWIEKYPEEHIKILEKGHEIVNHTYSHPNNEELNPKRFDELTVKEQKGEIEKCHEICKEVLDYAPSGFRTPHFGELHTDSVYGILKELGYKYSSSKAAIKTPSFGSPYLKDGILELPLSPCPKHPFGVFDTWHSLERGCGSHKKEGEFYKLFKELIEIGINTNSYINVYFDPQDVVKLKEFKMMLDYVEDRKKDIWVARYEDIVKKEKK